MVESGQRSNDPNLSCGILLHQVEDPPVKSKFDLIIPTVWLLSCLGIWCHKHFLFRMGNPSQQCNCTKNSIYNANNKNVYWKLFYICIKQAINTYYWIVAHNNSSCYPKSIIFRTRFFKYHTLPNLTSVNTIYDRKVCRPFPLCSSGVPSFVWLTLALWSNFFSCPKQK